MQLVKSNGEWRVAYYSSTLAIFSALSQKSLCIFITFPFSVMWNVRHSWFDALAICLFSLTHAQLVE